jgi:hypothetical protein
MPRRLMTLLLTVSLSAFAQFGGVVLPGGIRLPGGSPYPGGQPGGQYPSNGACPGGQYPTNGQCPGGPYPGSQIPNGRQQPGMGQMLYGNLRQISRFDLAIETDDSRIIQMQVSQNVRLYSEFGAARLTDFDPGDYVTVQVTQDMNGNYYANTITETRKGTPQERAAAQKPLNTSMHSGDNQNTQNGAQDDSSNSNRPVLHRAGGSTSSDDSTPAQVAPPQTAGATPMSGDPGPPTLRRGTAPRDQNAPLPDPDSTPQRPTVRAEDVNGVTQLPANPPPASEALPAPSGIAATDDPIVDKAREEAFAFTESLPDYIVKQYTTRYQSDVARGKGTSWQPLDIVTADVVAENGKETYKNLMVNGKPSKSAEQTGSWSEGEFASTLQAILSPASDALFTNRRTTTIVNRPAYRYDYSIEQPRSSWQVEAGGSRYRPAYGGAIWIDKETSRVLRIEMSARNIPRDFPLDQVESTVDYDFVLIGDHKYLLPTHSEALSCERGTTECSRNVIDFRNYKKYGADTNIIFDDPGK